MSTKDSWMECYNYLKSKGYDVYPPSTKKGICTKDYIVLKDASTSRISNFSSENHYYSIICYSKTFSGLMSLFDKVKKDMSYYKHMVPAGLETPSFFNEDVIAHSKSVQYIARGRNIKLGRGGNYGY